MRNSLLEIHRDLSPESSPDTLLKEINPTRVLMLDEKPILEFSRRKFIQGVQYAPLLFFPAPLKALAGHSNLAQLTRAMFPLADFRVTPHYPSKSPLDDMLRLVRPGSDQYITEKYAFELEEIMRRWGRDLLSSNTSLSGLQELMDPALRATSARPKNERKKRSGNGITVVERQFSSELDYGRDQFLEQFREYLASLPLVLTAEFQVIGIKELGTSPLHVEAEILYSLIGTIADGSREQRIGRWKTEWEQITQGEWKVRTWQAVEETVSRAKETFFVEVTQQAFGALRSYNEQLRYGADYWRTVLDGASGIDVYGNQGIAVGDYDGDGFDDVYICQPSGLPNRLYRNRGDGTFDDVTESSGLNVLDATSCALFADFDNQGRQDLLLVTSGGPLLFVNQGEGRFVPKHDAFKFARPPQGTFTHAAVADYDHDGLLDVYFCLYNYYAGLDQYRYPSPYFDARNGPPNFLFHNEGGRSFEDSSERAGLNVDNDRYSFACAWGDYNSNGWPDLYVANDFGRSNLYRNNGDGTFSSIATKAGVEDVGAGMSACWLDFDGDGNQDIYVANMWSAAGLRISSQEGFHAEAPENIRGMYRRHARGNSLYKNRSDGTFRNVAAETGVEFGRWAWSSDSWDFDHDGHADLCVANGYVSGTESFDLGSFFWRQVVGNSPRALAAAPNYENGWNAINELIRSDRSWSGYERNVFYCNNRDGTLSDVSGISGVDLPDDSRAFALADLDHDGRLEVLLKNRNAPQLRLLHNAMPRIGNSIVFRLRGTASNRDAIGAAVTLEASGPRQTKYVQAGSGFLSQHTKEVCFGVGDKTGFVKARIRWPSGVTQALEQVPVNHRIEVAEGSNNLRSTPFASSPYKEAAAPLQPEPLPQSLETWLVQPLRAPGFSLSDTSGRTWDLHSISEIKLLTFWSSASPESQSQLQCLAKYGRSHPSFQTLAMNVDDPPNDSAIRSFASAEALPFPLLTATPELSGTYNIVFRYLFDRHRNLGIPTSFLIDSDGIIVKVYQGMVEAEAIAQDVERIPHNSDERMKAALPFSGTLHLGEFQRNEFTYGVAFFQRGYLDAATDSFKQVIALKPDNAEAHYNLGTLYLRRKDFAAAHASLERAVQLKSNYPEAWNNLGMLAAEKGHADEAVHDFKQCISQRPDYVVALLNLGNLYRREKQFIEAEQLLNRARQVEPENPEVNYSLGMLYARQDQIPKAEREFERALTVRPEYPDALNNFGVLLVREQQYSAAEEKFRFCIQSNPNFDQAYLNLARLYVLLNRKDKAREVLEQLLRRQPEHPMAQEALKMLQ